MRDPALHQRLRDLPSVERLASGLSGLPHPVAVCAARHELDEARERIVADGESVDINALRDRVAKRAAALTARSLRPVINATGVVLHTNLGRAPLVPEAAAAAADIGSSYSNLEYDLDQGERISRNVHVEGLLRDLSGAEAAIAVNNNAAAVLLALAATASKREVIVSRGQLVEIGGSFRIPEILEQSGARLVEVGTTNRTRLSDYEEAVGPETAALMRVHQSNFRTLGFTEEVPLAQLAALARDRDLLLIDDLGSGAMVPIADEPLLTASVNAGADIVCCSADKLLGGPQAGILVGREATIERCRNHPLARALRLDKLQLAAVEVTLRLHRDQAVDRIPALRMLTANDEELQARAEAIATGVGPEARVERSGAPAGGGSLPLVEFAGPVCAVVPSEVSADELIQRLRESHPPIIARVSEGRVILDPRTMSDAEADVAAAAVRQSLGAGS